MKTKIIISLLVTTFFLFNANDSQAQWTVNAAGDVYNSNSSGLVGLGLTSPASLFHAAGQIRTGIPSGGLGGASATTGSLLFYNSSNTNTVNFQSGVTSTSYSMTLPAAQGASGTILTNDGSGVLAWYVDANWHTYGNTGITTPAIPATYGTSVFGGTENWMGTTDANDVVFGTNNKERMRIKQTTGNVGIGTTAPNGQLTVAGSGQASTSFSTVGSYLSTIVAGDMGGSAGNGGAIAFAAGFPTWANNGVFAAIKGSVTNGTGPFGDLQFCTRTTATDAVTTLTPKMTILGGGNVGIGITNPTEKLYVDNGNIYVNGSTSLTGYLKVVSDIRIKKDTSSFTDGLSIIKKIHPVYFKHNGKAGIKDTNKLFVGVIAQQIQPLAPYAIDTFYARLNNPNDTSEPMIPLLNVATQPLLYIAINSIKQLDSINTALVKKDSINGVKIKAIQATDSINTLMQKVQQKSIDSLRTKNTKQDSTIISLQNQLNQLASVITDCCNKGNGQGNHHSMQQGSNDTPTTLTNVELNNKNSIILNQNDPNPFSEQTTITYNIPDDVKQAQIIFSDATGRVIKTVEILEKGIGMLNVYASDLSNGTYTYSIIADGKLIDTKKMVRIK